MTDELVERAVPRLRARAAALVADLDHAEGSTTAEGSATA
jgi:hypothetical protein